MLPAISSHRRAVLQALFVTFLWSTSWVLIKVGLSELPALTFAGLRYTLAFLCLLPLFLHRDGVQGLRAMNPGDWGRLILLGLLFYTVTQGAQFMGLAYLPAITANLLFSLSALVVALLGWLLLAERPTAIQWLGTGLTLAGAFWFFHPVAMPRQQVIGVMIVLLGVVANAGSSVLGRAINRGGTLTPLAVTTVSMGVGSVTLLCVGIAIQGLPVLTLTSWLLVGWLAIVNTAFAFTLWNLTLHTLSALESSVINNTMIIQIPILAVLFLGESLSGKQAAALLLAGVGAFLVQWRRGQPD